MTLIDFLLARIATDEANARACDEWDEKFREVGPVRHKWVRLTDDGGSSFWDGCPDPRRVLAECEVKRRLVELHETDCGGCGSDEYPFPFPCDTLRLLALPYADHPNYREAWRP